MEGSAEVHNDTIDFGPIVRLSGDVFISPDDGSSYSSEIEKLGGQVNVSTLVARPRYVDAPLAFSRT